MDEITLEIDYDDVFLPVYKPLLTCKEKLKFLYGGRDSGKSRDTAQRKILKCLSEPHFRCILIKKTFNSIKDSQWQEIKGICEDWGIEHLFKFTESPLRITCINGNSFICRGMDDPAKIKSISNASDAWVEEGNQLELKDWIYIITTLRSSHGPVDIDVTFNTETEGDYEEFWLYKEYFSHTTEKTFHGKKIIKFGDQQIELKYIAIHSTYHDNKHCSLERKAYHENLASLNYYWYKVFTLGEWGNEENDSPWLFAFNAQVHMAKQELKPSKEHTLYLAFDFNRNPHVCTALQWYNETIYILRVLKIPNVGTEGICEEVLRIYPGFLYIITGDYSGVTVSSIYKEQVTNYSMIKKMLKISNAQVKIMPNPPLKSNQTLVNFVFQQYPIQICPVNAKAFKFDAENVKKRADGSIVKDNRDDPTKQADVLDTVRYWINKFMGWFMKNGSRKVIESLTTQTAIKADDGSFSIDMKLTKEDQAALQQIIAGKIVLCTRPQYHATVRTAILMQAGKWVEGGNVANTKFALGEITRLDKIFGKK